MLTLPKSDMRERILSALQDGPLSDMALRATLTDGTAKSGLIYAETFRALSRAKVIRWNVATRTVTLAK